MAARQIILPYAMPARDLNGRALASKLYFYTPGATLNTPKTVYENVGLSVAHEFPIVSDLSGRFPPIWADEDEHYDVVWTDSQGAPQKVFDNARGLSDSLAGSAIAAQVSADAALVSETNAATSETNAATDAASAAIDATRAETAAATTVLAAGFDPADYVQVAAQTLSTPEKLQARTNIGAVSQSEVDGSVAAIGILRSARTSNTILTMDDNRAYVDVTSGSFTQTITAASSLGNGWFVDLGNSGTGVITVDPNGAETIDGASTLIVFPYEVYRIVCDGSNFHAINLKNAAGLCVITQDQKSSGTEGGSVVTAGSYVTRAQNTVLSNNIGAILAANQITLLPGKYLLYAWGAVFGNTTSRLRIRNITDSTTDAIGPGGGGAGHSALRNDAIGVVTISSAKTFEVQQIKGSLLSASDLGASVADGGVEIYSEFRATRLP